MSMGDTLRTEVAVLVAGLIIFWWEGEELKRKLGSDLWSEYAGRVVKTLTQRRCVGRNGPG